MTPSQLKAAYQQAHPDGHFFDRKTMKFFGDTMKNFGCEDAGTHWYLWRKRPKPYQSVGFWFDKETFEHTAQSPFA